MEEQQNQAQTSQETQGKAEDCGKPENEEILGTESILNGSQEKAASIISEARKNKLTYSEIARRMHAKVSIPQIWAIERGTWWPKKESRQIEIMVLLSELKFDKPTISQDEGKVAEGVKK